MTNCNGCNQKIKFKQEYITIDRRKMIYATKKGVLNLYWDKGKAGEYCKACWHERFVIIPSNDKERKK